MEIQITEHTFPNHVTYPKQVEEIIDNDLMKSVFQSVSRLSRELQSEDDRFNFVDQCSKSCEYILSCNAKPREECADPGKNIIYI